MNISLKDCDECSCNVMYFWLLSSYRFRYSHSVVRKLALLLTLATKIIKLLPCVHYSEQGFLPFFCWDPGWVWEEVFWPTVRFLVESECYFNYLCVYKSRTFLLEKKRLMTSGIYTDWPFKTSGVVRIWRPLCKPYRPAPSCLWYR
jgi:hypothetical protein